MWISEGWRERRNRKAATAWAEEYVLRHGYDPKRDLATVRQMLEELLADRLSYLSELSIQNNELPANDEFVDEMSTDCAARLLENLSTRHLALLGMYFHGEDGVVRWLAEQVHRRIAAVEAGRARRIMR